MLEHDVKNVALTVPPELAEMEAMADEVVARNPGARRDGVILALNNAAWREVIEHIPYQNRLLMLPQCLRSSKGCKGTFDDLGLLCAGCGECVIAPILAEAERLGMQTVVAEGNTVVDAMLKSEHTIDAVIGVSCTAALRRIFPVLSERAIPSLAIALHGDGCRDTTVDVEAILAKIRIPYKVGQWGWSFVQEQLASLFTVSELEELCGVPKGQTASVVRDYVLSHGKRHRPALVMATYLAFSDGGSAARRDAVALPNFVKRAGLSIEFFHKASLIHDDIEDNDDERDGMVTLHRKYGIPFAINAGDMLVGEGYRILTTIEEPSIGHALLHTAATMHVELCRGQGMEFEGRATASSPSRATDSTVGDSSGAARRDAVALPCDEVFALKTGKAFEAALAFGLICAGVYDEWKGFCAEFSRHLGIAYQLRDDITDRSPGVQEFRSSEGEEFRRAYQHHRDKVYTMIHDVRPLRFRLLLSQLSGRILPRFTYER